LQAQWLKLLPRGRQVIAEQGEHIIWAKQPQIVVDSIREVVEAARKP